MTAVAKDRWQQLALVALLAIATLVALTLAPGQDTSRCTVTPDKVAAPAEIPLGATIRVTLTLTADCPPEPSPVDAMLVIDQSNSMADDNKITNAKAGARAFLDAMDLGQSRVGLVAFNQDAGIRSYLTSDRRQVEAAIDSLTPGGQTNISAAIELARQELGRDVRGYRTAMIVLTDGYNTVSGAEPVPDAAQRAKDDGITVVTVCAGGECDPDLLPAASDPSLYYDVPDTSQLAQLYTDLAGLLQTNGIASLVVTDQIPANMRYIPDSASPVPAEVGSDFLRWELAGVPASGLTYELEPLEEGTHPTNVVATGEFTDRRGFPGETVFPIPSVKVVASPCAPKPIEVYLLIDDSNCLKGSWLNDMPALEAIKLGTEKLFAHLSLGRDLAAVIGFGDQAVIFQTLTSDESLIKDAIDQISFIDNSARLDLAFVETARELASPRHRRNSQPVTIIVTDGPMTPAIDLAVARGEALRRQGVKHYAIAIGDALLAQQAALRSLAEPGGFRALPYNGDVLTVFDDFGQTIGDLAITCPPTPAPPTPGPSPTSGPERAHHLYLPSMRDNDG